MGAVRVIVAEFFIIIRNQLSVGIKIIEFPVNHVAGSLVQSSPAVKPVPVRPGRKPSGMECSRLIGKVPVISVIVQKPAAGHRAIGMKEVILPVNPGLVRRHFPEGIKVIPFAAVIKPVLRKIIPVFCAVAPGLRRLLPGAGRLAGQGRERCRQGEQSRQACRQNPIFRLHLFSPFFSSVPVVS